MARIAIFYFSDYGEVMYDAITKELLNLGNSVYRTNINGYIYFQEWGGDSKLKKNYDLKSLLSFKPELILNFNNSLPIEIANKIDSKICIIDADNPDTFWNKKYLNKNYQKYYFWGLQKYSYNLYKTFFPKLSSEQYCFIPPATSLRRKQIKKNKNILFIGSNFLPQTIEISENFYSKLAYDLYNIIKKNYFIDFEKEWKKRKNEISKKDFYRLTHSIRAYWTGQNRLQYLEVLADLGLHIYGWDRNWKRVNNYSFDIWACLKKNKLTSLEDNAWGYNTSKIAVNISHPQAISSFSWRVMDIMACDSCLVMEEKKDWQELFGNYISQTVLDNIIYKDRYDMREKVIRLLSNNSLREKCVSESNRAIEENGRWHQRFKLLEDFVGVKIVNLKVKERIYKNTNIY
ncbi:MAG: glycosyltransferase family 1 protein, partial [Legionellales bacterium]|nr:glycosyltransferase family 1 protein [Legionellales bacterium]